MRPGQTALAGRNALVGRDAEVERLAAAISAAQVGRGRIVLITGEPGIGKTALLAALCDQAAAAHARVMSGAAEELEMRIPFAAIADCLGLSGGSTEPAVAGIATLMRGAGRGGSGAAAMADTEFLVAEAILAMLDGWCAAGPVALALDDLQWADQASLLVLHRLGRVAGQLPLLLAAACRSGAGGADLEPLIRSWDARGAETIRLGPLDDASVVTLTSQVLGSAAPAPAPLCDAMSAASGNPLYVIELARALGAGQPRTAEAVPESLITVVTRRLSGLSPQAHRILQVAAVLGPSFTVAELTTVLSTPAIEFLGVIQEAAAAGVLAAESDRLAFRHEIIRQALYESLPVSARNALHLQAGQALAGAGAPVERAAQHLLAGTTLDARTLDWLVASAERLSARAPELAADLLSRVSDVAEPSGQQLGTLRFALATALLRAGRFAQAEAVAADAQTVGGQDGQHAGQLSWILAQSYLNQGRAADALAEAQQALTDDKLGRVERARFQGMLALCFHVVSAPGPGRAMEEAETARREGVASGDAYAMAYGLQSLAGAYRWQGRFRESASAARQAAKALKQAGVVIDSQLNPLLIAASSLFDLDCDAEAEQEYAADLRLAERGLGTYFLCFHHLSVARMYFLTGRWDDALTELNAAGEVPDHLGLTVHLDGLAALIAVHRHDRDELKRLQDSLGQPFATGPVRNTFDDRSWGRALAVLADGDQPGAFAVLSDAWQQCAAGNRNYCGHYLVPDLAALASSPAERDTARHAVDQLVRYNADRDIPSLHRSADFAAAILGADTGTLLAVADAYAAAGRPLLEAQAREHAAEALAVAGQDQQARQQLELAQDKYARLNASWDAARADARLRRCGIRRGAHGRRGRPKAGWAALTDTEQTVATLLAGGLSNPDIAGRMFISRRTVQFHVSNILAKLGLSSRVELAALVARQTT